MSSPFASSPSVADDESTPPVRVQREEEQIVDPRFDFMPQWLFLSLSLAVIVLAMALRSDGETEVVIPGTQIMLPTLCNFRLLLGLPCPGCGLTRCFIHMAHGNVSRAWHFNPVGTFLFVGVAAQIPFRVWNLVRLKIGRPAWHLGRIGTSLLIAFCAAMIAQWIWRLG